VLREAAFLATARMCPFCPGYRQNYPERGNLYSGRFGKEL